MKHLRIGVPLFVRASLVLWCASVLAAGDRPPPPPDATSSQGRYAEKAEGFYLGHFDGVGTLETCRHFGDFLTRGGEPQLKSEAWRTRWDTERVEYVLDLRAEGGGNEEKAVVATGRGYIRLPLTLVGGRQPKSLRLREVYPGEAPRTRNLDPVDATVEVLRTVARLAQSGRRVFIHCKRGEDRTGIFVALLRKCSSWRSEFRAYGGDEYPALKWLYERVSARALEY